MKTLAMGLVLFGVASVASGQGIHDIEPPELLDLWIEPNWIDTSYADQTVIVHFEVADNLTGVGSVSVRFDAPTSAQRVYASADPRSLTAGNLIHGTYEYAVTLPRYSELGTWRPQHIWLNDAIGNAGQHHYAAADQYLSDRGIDAAIRIGPVPEPATWALLLTAGLCLLWRRCPALRRPAR